jgi:DNA modification methylase
MNIVHHKNFLDNNLEDGCSQLIIADPPYFEVKGEFDFIWPNMAAYLDDVRKWAQECHRLLSPNGTLIWYGKADRIAYSQVIIDEVFGCLPISCPVWEKLDCQTKKGLADYRIPAPVTESMIIYDKDTYNLTECVNHIRDYIREEITKSKGKIVFKEVNEALGTATNGGGVASACLSLDKTEPAMITEEMYRKLQKWLNPQPETTKWLKKEYTFLRSEYEVLRLEYENKRRYFNNHLRLTDVFKFGQETVVSAKYDHETQKPEKLSRALITMCSRPGDLVLVPFAGSGTECAMAAKEGRNFIGFELDEKHVKTANNRVSVHLSKPQLFTTI